MNNLKFYFDFCDKYPNGIKTSKYMLPCISKNLSPNFEAELWFDISEINTCICSYLLFKNYSESKTDSEYSSLFPKINYLQKKYSICDENLKDFLLARIISKMMFIGYIDEITRCISIYINIESGIIMMTLSNLANNIRSICFFSNFEQLIEILNEYTKDEKIQELFGVVDSSDDSSISLQSNEDDAISESDFTIFIKEKFNINFDVFDHTDKKNIENGMLDFGDSSCNTKIKCQLNL